MILIHKVTWNETWLVLVLYVVTSVNCQRIPLHKDWRRRWNSLSESIYIDPDQDDAHIDKLFFHHDDDLHLYMWVESTRTDRWEEDTERYVVQYVYAYLSYTLFLSFTALQLSTNFFSLYFHTTLFLFFIPPCLSSFVLNSTVSLTMKLFLFFLLFLTLNSTTYKV